MSIIEIMTMQAAVLTLWLVKDIEAESVLIRGAINLDTKEQYDKIRLLGEALHIDYEIFNRASAITTKADLFLAGIVQLLCVLLAHKLHNPKLARRPRKLIA